MNKFTLLALASLSIAACDSSGSSAVAPTPSSPPASDTPAANPPTTDTNTPPSTAGTPTTTPPSTDSGTTPPPTTDSTTPPVTPMLENFTLIDPTEDAGNQFGVNSFELSNGFIAVRSSDSTNGHNSGAIHIFDPLTKQVVKSFYGNLPFDAIGTRMKPLSNGNLVIVSEHQDINGITDAGTVMLVNGTGEQIGSTLSGDNTGDNFGSQGVTELTNGNFVIASHLDNVNGISKAGSATLVSGSTGAVIGTPITGDNTNDNLSGGRITALSNGNYVITSPFDDTGINNSGSVILVDGTTGQQIGTPITGNNGADHMGSGRVFALEDGNYVISTPSDDVNGVSDAGSAILVNGTTGVQIGATIAGDNPNDRISSSGIVVLSSNQFLVSSGQDSVSGMARAGSVMFFDATTGSQLGTTLAGSHADAFYSNGSTPIELSNGNIVITSSSHNSAGGNTQAGMIQLINGSTKAVISSFSIDQDHGRLGESGVKDLLNGNFVIASPMTDVNGITDAGSVIILNGSTGLPLTTNNPFNAVAFGDDTEDQLGEYGVTVLANSNFVISSSSDDINGISDAGSVMLFNGQTGQQVAPPIVGNNTNDRMGSNGITLLTGSNNYVIASANDNVNGASRAGSVTLMNGETGEAIGSPTTGNNHNDFFGLSNQFGPSGVIALSSGNYLISSQHNDDSGNVNTGAVLYRLGQ